MTSSVKALVRSRFQNVAQIDGPSHFFFDLERKNEQKRFIHSLRSDTGWVLTGRTAICKHAVSFYSELFKCEHRERQAVWQQSYVVMEAALSSDELHAPLQSGKAPGINSLPVDFYTSFWSVGGWG